MRHGRKARITEPPKCSDLAVGDAASNAGEKLRADRIVAACLRAMCPGLEFGYLLEDLEGSSASVGPVGADRHQGRGAEALDVVEGRRHIHEHASPPLVRDCQIVCAWS